MMRAGAQMPASDFEALCGLVDAGAPIEKALLLYDLEWADLDTEQRAQVLKVQTWLQVRTLIRLQSRFETLQDGSALRALEMRLDLIRGLDAAILPTAQKEPTVRDLIIDDEDLLAKVEVHVKRRT